jgi:hypothetical protein
MKPLYDKLDHARCSLATAREVAASPDSSPRDAHEAKASIPNWERGIALLETDIELACAARQHLQHALNNLRSTSGAHSGRELSLSITHAEDALHRCTLHLGEAPKTD